MWLLAGNLMIIFTLDDGHDGALLDSRRALETVGVDTCTLVNLTLSSPERPQFSYLSEARSSGSSRRRSR
jgi:hypothetical protein